MTVEACIVTLPFQQGRVFGIVGKMAVSTLVFRIEWSVFVKGAFILLLYIIVALKTACTCVPFEQKGKAAAVWLMTGRAVTVFDDRMDKDCLLHVSCKIFMAA